MKIQKISRDGTTEFGWIIFAQSYFYIARLACQELLVDKIEKHDRSLSEKIKLPYKISNLYVAIIFNIKHGIEVFLKSLGILDSGEYEEGHDIYDLFQNLKKKMDGKINDEDLSSIEELITYFYKPDFIRPKIKELYEIIDVQNDIFRYPDNKAKIKIQWELIIDLFNKKDIEEIKNNLDKLLALFNKAGFSIENISKLK